MTQGSHSTFMKPWHAIYKLFTFFCYFENLLIGANSFNDFIFLLLMDKNTFKDNKFHSVMFLFMHKLKVHSQKVQSNYLNQHLNYEITTKKKTKINLKVKLT